MYGGGIAPSGWATCIGQSISRTTFAALFAVIGTSYGSSNSTVFNLPDLRGKVPRMFGTPPYTPLGASGGADFVTLIPNNLPAHLHSITDVSHSHTIPNVTTSSDSAGPGSRFFGNDLATVTTSLAFTGITQTNSNLTTNQPVSIVNPYLVLNYIIKVA
jgi:microcystin-dependent protein